MAPFVVMVGSLLLFRGLGTLGVPVFATWQECVRDAMVVLFLFTAGSRLTPMREGLIRMVPKYVPYPRLLVYVTGGLEALGAIGLLFPATRSAAGFCLAALAHAAGLYRPRGARCAVTGRMLLLPASRRET
jgi:hypothetical protein